VPSPAPVDRRRVGASISSSKTVSDRGPRIEDRGQGTRTRDEMRHSLRSLVKDPMFTVVVMLTIALGIAANTAIFSVVHAVLLKPPPFVDPDRLAVIWETDRNTGTSREPGSW